MIRIVMLGIAMVMAGTPATAQQRLPSPDGHAATEIGGRYVGTRDPAYVDGQWIEISYGRPIKRGRHLWGSPTTYARSLRQAACRRTEYSHRRAPNRTATESGGTSQAPEAVRKASAASSPW